MYALMVDEATLADLISAAVEKGLQTLGATPLPAAAPNELELFISRQEAAAQLGVSLPTLDKALHSGALRSNRIGRRVLIPKSAVNSYAGNSGR